MEFKKIEKLTKEYQRILRNNTKKLSEMMLKKYKFEEYSLNFKEYSENMFKNHEACFINLDNKIYFKLANKSYQEERDGKEVRINCNSQYLNIGEFIIRFVNNIIDNEEYDIIDYWNGEIEITIISKEYNLELKRYINQELENTLELLNNNEYFEEFLTLEELIKLNKTLEVV